MTARARRGDRGRTSAPAVLLALLTLLLGACSGGSSGSTDDADRTNRSGLENAGDCVVVDISVSSEKVELMETLADRFNASDEAKVGDRCVFVRPQTKASGAVTELLATTWDTSTEGPRPVIWSPAASSWGSILNQRLAADGKKAMVGDAESFMLTPLVIAMPKPMADALGYPGKPVGWADIARLATSKEGWAAYGHPEWGAFKLGKTNPNFSTSGLSSLVGQAYAATGKTKGLSSEDLDAKKTDAFARNVESAVVHYGDITMTFLNNWFRTDREGTSLQYASAVAIEEKSVIDYNKGNPDGVVSPGEQIRKPRVPLVAVYPKEGTLYSDNPLFILDAPWVDAEQRKGAAAFQAYLTEAANQRRVLDSGFRPGNPDVGLGSPIVAANGVDPSEPETLLELPEPAVLVKLLDKWQTQRKSARVQIVLDISGSMKEPADPADPNGPTKLDLAQKASIEALDEFKSDDLVGLRVFTTNLGPDGDQSYLDLVPLRPMSENKEVLAARIREQFPQNLTPLYDVTQSSYDEAVKGYDPNRINAVILLTDGMNEDGDPSDDRRQLQTLLADLRQGTQGEQATPVRVFPIIYGKGADKGTLRQIAEASNSAVYDASDPTTITKVFTAVVSNF